MAITIGAATFQTLTAQPFGYEDTDAKAGLTARQWAVQGLLSPIQWLSLLSAYDGWRNARITDEDTSVSLVVGTTINFSGTGAGGATWNNVPCWFSSSPTAEHSGAYLAVSFTVVDAAQALQVIQKQKENEDASATSEDLPDLGTYSLGGVVLTLTKPIDSYLEGPQIQLSANGFHYISGPKVAQRTRDIEGYFDTIDYPSGVSTIRTWYETQIVSTPSTGTYYPTSVPAFSAEKTIVSGVTTTRYTVSIVLAQLI